jgi:cytochrome c biogenesis protein CcmG/thiol:disulfide interchange protein DsbE
MNKKLLIPLALFVVLAGFLFVGLFRDPREVPSPLIDKPAPVFTLRQLHAPDKTLGTADMKGKVWLLNVWASWCVSCRVEHPLLVELAKSKVVPIDRDGRVGIDWGVYGVPETFVVDKAGVIRYKQIGPVTAEALEQKILPLVRELQKS